MRGESLATRELRRDRAEPLSALARDPDDARALLKIVDAERRREARRARGRQHVVGPRAIIAERLAAVAAEENRAGVADQWRDGMGIVERQFDVFGGDAIGQFGRFIELTDGDNGA